MGKIVVVSLPKCGTNLVAGLFRQLGYAVTGEGVDNRFPAWCERMDAAFVTAFPENTCCMFHGLKASALDGGLTHEWRRCGWPRVIFNYRDPRAALVSMINYLLSGRYSGAGWQQVGAEILASLPQSKRVDFAIEYFDDVLLQRYRESAWLLDHPRVASCAYERLVGEGGGGHAAEQATEVARLLAFVGSEADPMALAAKLFDPGARTFFRGARDAWRDSFSPRDLARFQERHGDILRRFGYPE
jgi:hypothetical protein